MFKRFYPTIYCRTPYTIDFKKIYDKGYRGILMDIDNTLVEHGAPSTAESESFFERLRSIGFNTCIISNNDKDRVEPFALRSGSPYICDAGKPHSASYIRGMNIMGTDKTNSLFVGDQMFTDIFGANNAGIRSILVDPVKTDFKKLILLKRAGEAIVKVFYFRYSAKHPAEL